MMDVDTQVNRKGSQKMAALPLMIILFHLVSFYSGVPFFQLALTLPISNPSEITTCPG